MQYYKKYRIIENAELCALINTIIRFFHNLPIIGKFTGDKYKFYRLKKFVYFFGPIFSILKQIVISYLSFLLAIFMSGFILWIFTSFGKLNGGIYDTFFNIGKNSYAFLAFYLSPTLLANEIYGSRFKMRMLGIIYKIKAKESSLIFGIFEPLLETIGRILPFCMIFSLKEAVFLTFIINFLGVSISGLNLHIFDKYEKDFTNKALVVLGNFVLVFFLCQKIRVIDEKILLISFALSLIFYLFTLKYLFSFDNYGKILEKAKFDQANISTDPKEIYKASISLKKEDLTFDKSSNVFAYEFLNKLFFQRHKRIIIKPLIKKYIFFAGFLVLAIVFGKIYLKDISDSADKIILTGLIIITYILFKIEKLSRIMFENCDRSLMVYGFYKDKKAIFDMYKFRLRSILKISLPALLVILLALSFIYFEFSFLTLKNLMIYGIFAIIAYIFYPSFDLFNYYSFQPYDVSAMSVGKAYNLISRIFYYINSILIPIGIWKGTVDKNTILLYMAIIMALLIGIFAFAIKTCSHENFRIKK